VYVARVQAPAGFTVDVSPSTIVVPPRKSVSFKVTVKRTTAAFGTYSFGALNWSDLRGHNVRSPIAVRAVALSAPDSITKSGTTGLSTLPVKTGYKGTLTAKPFGLAAPTLTTHTLTGTETAFDPAAPATGPAVSKDTLVVPAGTKVARFQTFAADYPAGTDLDLYVFDSTGMLVGASAGGTADESVTVSAPDSYDVYVVAFADPPGASSVDAK